MMRSWIIESCQSSSRPVALAACLPDVCAVRAVCEPGRVLGPCGMTLICLPRNQQEEGGVLRDCWACQLQWGFIFLFIRKLRVSSGAWVVVRPL